MPKYKKKPVIVEAMVCAELMKMAKGNFNLLPRWIRDAHDAGYVFFGTDHIRITTPEGNRNAEFDDMVVCDMDGGIYPCKPDIFVKTYDVVEESDGDYIVGEFREVN